MEYKLPNTVPVTTVDAITVKKVPQSKRDENSLAAPTFSTKDATANLQQLLQSVGFTYPKKLRWAYIPYAFILNGIMTLLVPLSFGLSYWRIAHTSYEDLDLGILMNSIQLFYNIVSCELKIWILVMTRRTWRSAYLITEHLDRQCAQSPEEKAELRLCVRNCNLFVKSYLIFYWTYSACTFVTTFFNGLPMFNIYIPFVDWRRSRPEFVAASLIEFMMLNVASARQVFNDTFSQVHVYIMWTHMKILMLRFAKLGNASLSVDENLAALKQCIRDHKSYLELYNILEPIISTIVFLQFLLTAMILGTTLVNILVISTDFYSRIGSCAYIVAVITQILPLCYTAQCLMIDSSRLAEVIFHSNWIGQDVRYRKMLIFLIQRTQCFKILMAGKLLPIDLTCFLSIVKYSFTLYTFIQAIGVL